VSIAPSRGGVRGSARPFDGLVNLVRLELPPGRLAAVDGLRGLSALAVLVYHVYHTTDPHLGQNSALPHPVRLTLDRLGPYAVIMFFVVSGFLVGGPFVRATARRAPFPELRRYLTLRLVRIYPAWLVVLAVFLALSSASHDLLRRPLDLAAVSALQQNYVPHLLRQYLPHAWSLVIEISFYAVLPMLAVLPWLAARRVGRRTAVALAALGPLTLLAVSWSFQRHWFWHGDVPHPDGRPLSFSLLAYGDGFALGMLVALVAHCGVRLPRLAAAAVAAVAVHTWWHGTVSPYAQATTAVAAALVLAVVALSDGPAVRLLATRPLRAVGVLTYGVYLWHLPLLYALVSLGLVEHGAAWQTVPAVVGLCGLTVLVALCSWKLVESPANAWAHRVAPRARAAPARA
jgi:peptidoglycan/LPS O-acetylase OafA/YrhL